LCVTRAEGRAIRPSCDHIMGDNQTSNVQTSVTVISLTPFDSSSLLEATHFSRSSSSTDPAPDSSASDCGGFFPTLQSINSHP
jgi:hypothetical protein